MNRNLRLSRLEGFIMSQAEAHGREFSGIELGLRILFLMDQVKRYQDTGIRPPGFSMDDEQVKRFVEIMAVAKKRKELSIRSEESVQRGLTNYE